MTNLAALTQKAVRLATILKTSERKVEKDKIALGEVLMQVRSLLGVKSADGKLVRGPNGGGFSDFLKTVKINYCMAYHYMSLAGLKVSSYQTQPSRQHISYWQKFNHKIRVASPARKIILLRQAVKYLVNEYEIPAKVTVT